jgi:hypothetical protein
MARTLSPVLSPIPERCPWREEYKEALQADMVRLKEQEKGHLAYLNDFL